MKRFVRAVYGGDAPSGRCCRLRVLFLMVVITCLSFVPGSALASAMAYAGSPTLQVSAGFGTYFRVGAWVPLYITLHNNGSDFNGMLATSNPEGLVWQDTYSMVPSSIYQQPVTVPRGTQKQVTLYLPITAQSTTVSIIVQLLDSYGRVIQSQSVLLHQLYAENVFVGLLSDQINGFDALRRLTEIT